MIQLCATEGCTRPVILNRAYGRGRTKRHCSDRCRDAARKREHKRLPLSKEQNRVHYLKHRDVYRARAAERYRGLGDQGRAAIRAARYGLTAAQLDSILAKPCPCGAPATQIDHDHSCCPGTYSCGRCVRGGLCGSCNVTAGAYRDDHAALERKAAKAEARAYQLRALAAYLQR